MTATSVSSPEKPFGDRIGQLKATQPLIQDFIPGLKKKTANEYCGPCPHCKDGEDRFIVFTETQTYWCRQCNAKGDILSYITLTTGKSIREQLAEAGLLDSPPKSQRGSKEKFIWSKSKPGDRPAIRYLTETRGIANLQPSPAIRWNAFKPKDGKPPINRIVLRLSKPSDNPEDPASLHYLFLDTSANPPRKTGSQTRNAEDGAMKGRAVWFYPDKDTKSVAVAEGAETTLSVLSVLGLNGAAALTTSGLKGIVLPQDTKELFIFCDQDTAEKGCAGQKAALELAKRFEQSGGTAWIVSPSDQCFADKPEKLDFNDLLKQDPSGASIKARFEKKQRLDEIAPKPSAQEKSEQKHSPAQASQAFEEYPAETLRQLQELNEQYAACLLSGKFWVLHEYCNEAMGFNSVEFADKHSFADYHANRKCLVYDSRGKLKKAKLIKTWMEWEGRRSYDSVVFAPDNKKSPTSYNLFRGFAVKPKPGDWSFLQRHIREGLCGGNEQYYKYLISWMARIIQDPGGKRPGVSVVLRGGKGIGKGTLANCFGKLFGEAFVPVSSNKGLTGDFNMHLAKALLVFADEAVWGGDKQAEGRLKALITEQTLDFEPKGIDKMTMKNHVNLIIASNEEWAVPASEDERRFFVLDIEKKPYMTHDFWAKLNAQMENGGYEAMMHDLLQWDCSAVNLRDVPQTEGLIRQKLETIGPVMECWFNMLDRGFLLSHSETGGPRSSQYEDETVPEDERMPPDQWPYEV